MSSLVINYIPELSDKFLMAQDTSETTRDVYRKALKPFLIFLEELSRAPVYQDIIKYKKLLISKGYSPYTVNSYLITVRKLFKWLSAQNLYPNITEGIKGLKQPKGFQKACLGIDEVRLVLGSIDRTTVKGRRDYALINLLVRTGLRTIEIIRSDIGDITRRGGQTILRVQGKGRNSKDDYVVLSPSVLKSIMESLEDRTIIESDPLFTSLSNSNNGQRLTTRALRYVIKDVFKNAGIWGEKLSAHSLRHTAITLALKAGSDLRSVQAMARHADINTTLVYAQDKERLEQPAELTIDSLLA